MRPSRKFALLLVASLPAVAARTAAQSISPTERQLLEAEHLRGDATVLIAGTRSSDARIQRIAVRAIGRLERPALQAAVEPLLRAADARVRMEAVNALGQMNVAYTYAALLAGERDAAVRAVIYETVGRVRPTPPDAEALLARGLGDAALVARAGAARGLESLVRRTGRTTRPTDQTLAAARRAVRETERTPLAADMRENALLALSAAGDRDSATIAAGLRDPSEQVRRVAVSMARRWMPDPTYIVRWAALRYAGDCDRFIAAIGDENEHVRLQAIDSLGGRECDLGALIKQLDQPRSWRMQAHALVALARRSPASARARLPLLAASPRWQTRVYASQAARVIGDTAALARLAQDADANVAAASLVSTADIRRALGSSHAGLVVEAMELVERTRRDTSRRDSTQRSIDMPTLVAPALEALDRFTRLARERVTVRDPRIKILDFVKAQRPSDNGQTALRLRSLLGDADPAVAAAAAGTISALTGTTVQPSTATYRPAPLPADAYVRALRGARARIAVRDVGVIEVELLADDATVTVATFAALAERGAFNGLTFHRIVPNFVVQGGSPGANEYDALTPSFMRDELGLTRNARGTFGVSTRGRDTGDGQLYINLIDNFRLDHDYTVFARTISGLPVVDRIQEGDVIDSIRIIRSSGPR